MPLIFVREHSGLVPLFSDETRSLPREQCVSLGSLVEVGKIKRMSTRVASVSSRTGLLRAWAQADVTGHS